MSAPAKSSMTLPPKVARVIEKLGSDLLLARKRRKESLRSWSARIGVSVPTLRRMEAGDPNVGISAYATALWLIGRSHGLEIIADPAFDGEALTIEMSNILKAK